MQRTPEDERKQNTLEMLKKKAELEKQKQEALQKQSASSKGRLLKVPELERIEEDEEEEEPEKPQNLGNMGSTSNIRQLGNNSGLSSNTGTANPMRKSADGFNTSDPMAFAAPPSNQPSKFLVYRASLTRNRGVFLGQ